jgi:Flp pilus assembly protein TadD
LDTYGWILVSQGKADQALPMLKKATGLAPGNASMHYHYAQALAKTGDRQGARNELGQALKDSQKFPELDAARALLAELSR